jgi:vacuolar-type H+-ATPase subunit I/STV1
MAKVTPLTIPNIISAMKQAGFVTKNDLDKSQENLRKQINDDQFAARTEFHANMVAPRLETLERKVEKIGGLTTDVGNLTTEVKKIGDKVDKLSLEVAGIKDDVKGLTEEFATTPSRKEFEEFKRAVISS